MRKSLIDNLLNKSRTLIASSIAKLRFRRSSFRLPPARAPAVGGLEDRILLSASPVSPELISDQVADPVMEAPVGAAEAEAGATTDVAVLERHDASSLEAELRLHWNLEEDPLDAPADVNAVVIGEPNGDGLVLFTNEDGATGDQGDAIGLFATELGTADTNNLDTISDAAQGTAIRRELVFVDTAAADYQQLVDDILAQRGDSQQFEVILLDSRRDGMDQIAQVLAGHDDVDALHIVSHGTGGAVQLGSTWLRLENVDAYASDLKGWGNALSSDADLLFYGCDLASNENGQLLVEALSALTAADVAASTDTTGNELWGGDWDLEYAQGAIETAVVFSTEVQDRWMGSLSATPAGSETLVNTTSLDQQKDGDVAVDADGDFVVGWESKGQDGDSNKESNIYFQRYDAAGNPLGIETLVNTSTTGNQKDATVAVDDDGDFVVVWEGDGDQVGQVDDKGVFFQRFNSAGVAQGVEIRVNTTTADDQKDAAVAMDADGDFVVAWESKGQDGDKKGIYFQQYDASGNPLGSETIVNTTTTGDQKKPDIAMDSDGDFVVAWEGNGDQVGQVDDKGIFSQRFNSSGVAQGGEIRVNTTTADDQKEAAVAMDADGDFVVVWESKGQDGDTGKESNIYFQRHDALGNPLGSETIVNTTTMGNQKRSDIVMDSFGDFVVVWEGNGPGDADGVFGQQFDSAGSKVNGQLSINTTTLNKQQHAAAAMSAIGDFVVVWDGDGTGDADGVFFQRYEELAPLVDLNGAGNGVDFATTFTEGGGSVLIEGSTATLSDLDSVNLSSLTGTITNLLDGIDEVLTSDTSGTSIVASYNSTTGVLSLTGADTVANYQQVLRTIRYNNTSQNPNTTDRQIQFVANDGTEDGNIAVSTVTVNEVNDPPNAGADFTTTVAEESANGTAVATVTATDAEGDTLTYAITAGDPSGGFAIDAAGNITIADAGVLDLDFDDGTDLVATLTVQVSDGALTDTVDVTVKVTPINDNTPSAGANFTATVAEESANGTAVGTVTATDLDLPGDTLSYAITAGDPSSGFAIDAAGNITIADASVLDLDFDDGTLLVATLTVEVSDGALTGTVDVTVRVTPVNDNGPTDIVLDNVTVTENVAGAVIGNLTTTDADLGDIHTYTVDDARFEVVGGQLKLMAGQSLNYESAPTVDVIITATDSGGLNYDKSFTIMVSDVNEAPTVITLDNLTMAGNVTGVVVGNLSVIDVDAGDTHTWAVNDSRFEVVAGQLKLKTGQSVDPATEPSVNLTVSGTDTGGLSVPQSFTITVTTSALPPPTVEPPEPSPVDPPTTHEEEPSPEVDDETTEPSENSNPTTALVGALPSVKRVFAAGRGLTRLNPVSWETGTTAGQSRVEIAQEMTDYFVRPRRFSQTLTESILALDVGLLGESLDSFRDQIAINTGYYKVLSAGTASAIATASAFGYTIWTLRSGYLLASFISSLGAWSAFDPLPILSAARDAEKKEDEPQDEVEIMFSQVVEPHPKNAKLDRRWH